MADNGMFSGFGATLKEMADKLFGSHKEWSGLYPGDKGYLQSIWGDLTVKERGPIPARPASGGLRYDQIQRRRKLARKGPRNYARRRHEN